ncbi:cytochrome c-type biogenesis protein [Desertibaculum subflavum]|uniref:cytochrome c-type biogenesis protein n=1 Tax=Desertibaculum subflavum TaxID=2268458 RepID=UPI000E662A22
MLRRLFSSPPPSPDGGGREGVCRRRRRGRPNPHPALPRPSAGGGFKGAFLALLLLAAPAFAIGVDEPLPDPAQELRAREIAKSLRCLVCQNQSIEDSNAPLAKDLRRIVRERIEAGDSDAKVQDYVVARYGDWVLLKPPFNARTAALWIGPFALLGLAGIGVAVYYRRLATAAKAEAPPPLTAEERARLDRLVSD